MPESDADRPRWYILHGDDEFSRDQAVRQLRSRLAAADPAMAELNTNILDGSHLTLGELRHACDSVPFLAERRLVIVHGLLARLATGGKRGVPGTEEADPDWKRAFRKELAAYLPGLPATTRLVFFEPETLKATHPILKLAQGDEKKRARVRFFALPKDQDLPGWIGQHAVDMGGKMSREAAELLAALVGPDLRLLEAEIDKLLLYVDGQRPVGLDDIRRLVSRAREASIFDLVDCVGKRQTDRALQLLHRMLEDEGEPLQILSMLARQVRILIQVSELKRQGLTHPEITARLKLHPFVVGKTMEQAENFDLAQLEAAHARVVETDWAIKTGRLDTVSALDLLVVGLNRR